MTARLRGTVGLFGVFSAQCWDIPAGGKCMKQIDTSVAPNLPRRLSDIGLRDSRLSVLCRWVELGQPGPDLMSTTCPCSHPQVSLTKNKIRSV